LQIAHFNFCRVHSATAKHRRKPPSWPITPDGGGIAHSNNPVTMTKKLPLSGVWTPWA